MPPIVSRRGSVAVSLQADDINGHSLRRKGFGGPAWASISWEIGKQEDGGAFAAKARRLIGFAAVERQGRRFDL